MNLILGKYFQWKFIDIENWGPLCTDWTGLLWGYLETKVQDILRYTCSQYAFGLWAAHWPQRKVVPRTYGYERHQTHLGKLCKSVQKRSRPDCRLQLWHEDHLRMNEALGKTSWYRGASHRSVEGQWKGSSVVNFVSVYGLVSDQRSWSWWDGIRDERLWCGECWRYRKRPVVFEII